MAYVEVLTNNIHYARVTQRATNAPSQPVYFCEISETNNPDLDFIRAINWLTFTTNMPAGTTLLMDSNVIYTFNPFSELETNI